MKEEAERRQRQELEQNMAEAVLRQMQGQGTKADPGPGPRPGEEPIKTFRGVSTPLVGHRPTPPAPPPNTTPSFFSKPRPPQQAPPMTQPTFRPTPPASPTAPAAPLRPYTPPPRPYWGWSIVGLLGSFVFGFIALYFSGQVGERLGRGDVAGAQRASSYARTWGIVGLVVGVLTLIYFLSI